MAPGRCWDVADEQDVEHRTVAARGPATLTSAFAEVQSVGRGARLRRVDFKPDLQRGASRGWSRTAPYQHFRRSPPTMYHPLNDERNIRSLLNDTTKVSAAREQT